MVGFIAFWDQKRNQKITTYPLSEFLDAWRAYLWKLRPGHFQLRQQLVPGDVVPSGTYSNKWSKEGAWPKWHGMGGRLKRSARAVQLFGRLAVLDTHTLRY